MFCLADIVALLYWLWLLSKIENWQILRIHKVSYNDLDLFDVLNEVPD